MSYPWMETAKKLVGTKEVPGPGNNKTIIEWAKAVGGYAAKYYTKDEIPWCGLFVAHCLEENNLSLPSNPLYSLDYLKWGQKIIKPTPGAVMIFVRPGGGHIGFYLSEDKESYHILGGNQSDMVNVTRVEKSRLKGIRWPKEVSKPTTGPVTATFKGPLSTNEA